MAGELQVIDNLQSPDHCQLMQHRGVAGYFDGLSLRMSRKVLSSAIIWTVYEGFLLFSRARSGQDE